MIMGMCIGCSPYNAEQSVITQAIAVLRRFGTDAHVYLPGVGMLNGLQAGNFIDSALTTPAAIDNPVGGVVDAMGGINATQPTTSAKPILRRGAVNLLTYSGDFSNAVWRKLNGISVVGAVPGPNGALATRIQTDVNPASHLSAPIANLVIGQIYTAAVTLRSDAATLWHLQNTDSAFSLRSTSVVPITTDYVTHVLTFTAVATAERIGLGGNTSGSFPTPVSSQIDVHAIGIFQGTYTAHQIQALGGIPTTLTAPVSTALGAYWWDTSGSKSLVATFPAGNESVTVINATPTGQDTTTAQNVVGAYSINTNTNGRIIVNGVLTASELALLQSYANRLAGL